MRGVSAGTAVTSMPGTNTGGSAILDAGRDINHGAAHWGWSARFLFEGDDGSRVDRRGVAGQLWYVQEVTPGFSMRAGIGPYLTRNRREQPVPDRTRRNVLISLQAERALSDRTRIFFDFGRVKTFLRMDDRDLFLVGIRKRFEANAALKPDFHYTSIMKIVPTLSTSLAALLLACAGLAQAQTAPTDVTDAPDDHGAYLSAVFGNGRIHGGNAEGNVWMRGRTFEIRAGRQQRTLFGSPLPDSLSERIDFVHYNEGHPDNNHRDGFAVQWLMVRQLGARSAIELGVGPYLSMNTTVIDGRQIDDANVGALVSVGLRLPLGFMPDGTHLRIGYNHVQMRDVHRSDALMIGIGRQFGRSETDPETDPADGQTWFGLSAGNSITNMSGTDGAMAAVLEARRYLGERMEHWAVSGKFLFEGDDGARVDRRGLAAQLFYVQRVTPRFAMSAGLGPYVARNRRADNETHGNLLITFQAEHALTRHARVFANFNRVKTFRQTDDRDLFQVGFLKDF